MVPIGAYADLVYFQTNLRLRDYPAARKTGLDRKPSVL